jgi:uncharacterized protein
VPHEQAPTLTDDGPEACNPILVRSQNPQAKTKFRRCNKSSVLRSIATLSTVVSNLDQQCEPRPVQSVARAQSTRRKTMPKSGSSKRGFAAMDPAKQREIASKGGKASHGGGRKAGSSSR